MAISKRLRFEILRRDGFRCYYCGVRGNEALERDLEAEEEYRTTVWGIWGDHAPSYLGGDDLDGYIDTWFKESVPLALVNKAFRIASSNREVPKRSMIAYAGGVIRNTMREAERNGT